MKIFYVLMLFLELLTFAYAEAGVSHRIRWLRGRECFVPKIRRSKLSLTLIELYIRTAASVVRLLVTPSPSCHSCAVQREEL